ncbi:MAG TPA: M20/M25/M40 family metallo-hydrolase [Bryobacteraceae bacterium]
MNCWMRRLLWLAPLGLSAAQVSPKTYLADVTYLASPELKGRGTGSPELEKAAAYIAGQFKSFGLKPADGKDFRLEFPVTIGARLGADNSFRYKDGPKSVALESGRDYTPFSFSSSGKFSGEVVFAGYGITAPELHYDDYAGVDVKGKIALILRHEPQESDAKSVFDGKALTGHATFASKAANAKAHGARGVILINDIYAHPLQEDKFEKFGVSAGPHDAGIFFVQVKASTADRWIAAEGRNLRQLAEGIDRDLMPQSFALSKLVADLDVEVRQETRIVHNVAAYMPGSTDEYVILGAHYDHLGLGDENSLAPSQIGTIHPGADDNASGTAGVIELARWFSSQPKQKRGVLFLTFAGEELGLLGSGWYVNHPILPLEKAVAMINMDMIGRVRDGNIYLSGTGTGSNFPQLVESLRPEAPIHIDLSEKSGYGASDHSSFTAKGVPVLFFFSGLHGDYHKPSDTADKIDAADAAKVLDYVGDLAEHLITDSSRPQYQRVAETHQQGPSGTGGGGYGPNFGSIPDFNEPPKGVRFADVRDGTPAAKAGLRQGDILIEFGGKEIGNLYDFTYALRSHKAGDEVLVKVLRGSQTIEAKVLLTERR